MAKPSKSKVQTNTLAFFRAWLEGVEEMQGEDWTPSPDQWRRIREKLMAIEDTPVVEAPVRTPVQQPFYQSPAPSVMPQQSSAFMPALAPAPAPQPAGQPFGNQPSQKTPDIDSSNGYQSTLV